jgi:hypothetical protein
MATTLVDVIEVKNTSNQIVILYIKPQNNSPIFAQSGQIKITPNGSVVAEDNRFDQQQLISIQNNNLIILTRSRRVVGVTPSSGSGSGSI